MPTPSPIYCTSIRLKILVPVVCTLLLVIACLSVSILSAVDSDFEREVMRNGRNQAQLIARHPDLVRHVANSEVDEAQELLSKVEQLTEGSAAIAVYHKRPGAIEFECLAAAVRNEGARLLLPNTVGGEHFVEDIYRVRQKEMDWILIKIPIWSAGIERSLTALEKTPPNSWQRDAQPIGMLVLVSGLEEALASTMSIRSMVWAFGLFALMIGVLLASHLSNKILQPVRALHQAMQQAAAGDLDQRVEITGRDEIASMATSFNDLANQLCTQEVKIRGQARDLEERVESRTAELRQAIEELQTLDQAKDSFLSGISHEMRTPLTMIVAACEILEEFAHDDREAHDEFLSTIRTESERMSTMIDDVLDLAALEARTLRLNLEECDLVELCREVGTSCATVATHHLDFDLRAESLVVQCDRVRLSRALKALVDNAMQHTPAGTRVTVGVRTPEFGAAGATMWVEDDGPGIGEKTVAKLFGNWSTASRARLKSHEGLGFGLQMVRHLAHLHGGSLDYKPGMHGGARFVITVLRAPKQHDSMPDSDAVVTQIPANAPSDRVAELLLDESEQTPPTMVGANSDDAQTEI